METEDEAIKRVRLELIIECCIEGKDADADSIKHVQANRNTLEYFNFIFDGNKLEYSTKYKGKYITIKLRDVLSDTMDISYLIYYAQEQIDKDKSFDNIQQAEMIRKGYIC